tara:strand:- start:238 stop:408 length:171 start_codon:yes stop_codon:yes gene_type:complete
LNLLSWIKGLLTKKKKVTHITLRQKIKNYNNKEHEEYQKLVESRAVVEKKYWRYFK